MPTKHTASEDFPAPIPFSQLHAFVLGLPEDAINASAVVEIKTRTEGQRDPVDIGYTLIARWER